MKNPLNEEVIRNRFLRPGTKKSSKNVMLKVIFNAFFVTAKILILWNCQK